MKIRRLLWRLRTQVKVYWLLFKDARTPKISKIMLVAAIIYLLWPFDLIPDFLPFAGFIDELIIVPLIFYIATLFIPKNVVEDNKRRAQGIKKRTKDNDEIQEGVIVD